MQRVESMTVNIHSYNYKPEPIFNGNVTNKLYFGVELEVDKGGLNLKKAKRLLDIGNPKGSPEKHIYIKKDASLVSGFEIVSHPATLQYHLNIIAWDKIFKEAIELDYRSHDTNTCGFHISFSRIALGETKIERMENIGKLIYLFRKFDKELLVFSRRKKELRDHWAKSHTISQCSSGVDVYKKAELKNRRRSSINIMNKHTVECRLFKGTLDCGTFKASLQLLDILYEIVMLKKYEEIVALKWGDIVQASMKYTELILYLLKMDLCDGVKGIELAESTLAYISGPEGNGQISIIKMNLETETVNNRKVKKYQMLYEFKGQNRGGTLTLQEIKKLTKGEVVTMKDSNGFDLASIRLMRTFTPFPNTLIPSFIPQEDPTYFVS
jgi:hypothetical protein